MRYFNTNFYADFAEVYRNIHARSKPIYLKGHEGDENFIDDSRTNVCVPDHFVMLRRGTARLTRNPPNLRVRGGPDSDMGQAARDKVSAHLMFQWDRAEKQRAFKRIVSMAYGLGWAVGSVYYDEVPIVRRLRKLTTTLAPGDFKKLENSNDPDIQRVMQQFGPRLRDETPFSTAEYTMMMQELGDEVSLDQSTVKYRGAVLAAPFIGDVYPEPGFPSMHESGYVVENAQRDADWLKYWTKIKSIDPRDGTTTFAISEEAAQKCLDKAGSRQFIDQKEMTLRRLMRDEIEIADPVTSGKPIRAPRKRVLIDSRHTIVDGHLAIDFVGEEEVYLGRLWYPWETYGKYTYAEMVLIPDWLGSFGQSTLMVSQFLLKLRNVRLNQITDFVNNKLLPLLKIRGSAEVTKYDLVRTGFARALFLDNMGDVEPMADPVFPAEAWQDTAQLQQQMQQVDPTTVDFSPGTSEVSTVGKFATTAKLADKVADSVTADTLDQVGMFIRDVVELELAMNQQAMNEPDNVPKTYFQRIEAESIKNWKADARLMKVTPWDYQEIYEILPEQGSTLAADDDFRVAGLQNLVLLGERHPDIVNMRAVITALVRAMPGVNAEDVILPPPPPTPPVPPVKMNISLAIKWEQLPADVQAAILQHEGLPTDLTHVEGVGKLIGHISKASDDASNLEAPVDHTPQAPGQNGQNGQSGKPNGKAPRAPAKR